MRSDDFFILDSRQPPTNAIEHISISSLPLSLAAICTDNEWKSVIYVMTQFKRAHWPFFHRSLGSADRYLVCVCVWVHRLQVCVRYTRLHTNHTLFGAHYISKVLWTFTPCIEFRSSFFFRCHAAVRPCILGPQWSARHSDSDRSTRGTHAHIPLNPETLEIVCQETDELSRPTSEYVIIYCSHSHHH